MSHLIALCTWQLGSCGAVFSILLVVGDPGVLSLAALLISVSLKSYREGFRTFKP